jgi:hypothetical protein
MAHWEFLIQEEGSRVWSPIATTATLTPGRYRLVVRSVYPDTEMEVRVTHRLETDPPKQRSVARSRQTTPQGLMVVVPFTTFKPGHWEITCTPVTEAETAQHSLQLRVVKVAVTSEVEGKSSGSTPEKSAHTSEKSFDPVTAIVSEIADWENESSPESPLVNSDAILQSVRELEQLLQQELNSLLQDSEAISEDIWVNEQVKESQDIPQPTPLPDFSLQLDLETNAFVATHGETLAITGKIQLLEQLPEDIADFQLHYQLWHPQNQDLILDIVQGFDPITFPFTFNRSLIVPRQQGTCLLLGEVVLTAKVSNTDVTLASQPFTITLNVSDILDNILAAKTERENEIAEAASQAIVASDKPKPIALDLPSLNYSQTEASRQNTPLSVQASGMGIIPPKINKPPSNGHKSIKLPSFPTPPPKEVPPSLPATEEQEEIPAFTDENNISPVESAVSIDATVTSDTSDLAELPEDLAIPETFPSIKELEAESPIKADTEITQASSLETEEETETTDASYLEIEEPTVTEDSLEELEQTPENIASEAVAEQFQSLKLQKRFWYRLSDLATDEEAAQWLQEQKSEPTTETKADSSPDEEAKEENTTISTGKDTEAEKVTADGFHVDAGDATDATDLGETVEVLEWEETPSAAELDDLDESLVEIAASDSLRESPTTEDIILETSAEVEDEIETPEAGVVDQDFEKAVDTDVETDLEDQHLEPQNRADTEVETEAKKEILKTEEDLVVETNADATPDAETDTVAAVEVITQDETDPNQLEIVLDDEEAVTPPPVIQRDTSGMPYPHGVMPPRRESPLITQSTQPVPTPILLVSPGDLTAGEAIILGVKVPPYEGSVYVKLWIQDRQNRTILDGPRTFVDFEFHADGERETLTQVTIPYGSMEIQLDAIAINPQTQQESHKATVERTVVPADLPSLSLQEFELDG